MNNQPPKSNPKYKPTELGFIFKHYPFISLSILFISAAIILLSATTY